MAEAREFPLWYNNVWLGYIDTRKCRNKKAPFFYDIDHNPIYVDDFCRQTGLKRTTWRQSICVEKPDGEVIPAFSLIAPPNMYNPQRSAANNANRQVRRRPAPPAAPPARQTPVEYFSGLFSIARPPSQEAREAAREAAAVYLAEVDAREAARQETAHAANSAQDISARERHLISLADAADLPMSAAGDEEKICVICHEALMSGRRLAATECGHVFCAGCISMGLRHKDECPACRKHQPNVTALFI
jgi:hypothetical protein